MTAPFYVLAVDPGANSGAALFNANGAPICTVQLKRRDAKGRQRMVQMAVRRAYDNGADLVIMRERWQAGGKRANPKMLAGLGAAWGLWLEQLYLEASFLPASRVLKVYPSTWKSRVLKAHAADADGWSRLVHAYVKNRFGFVALGGDEAVAVCIGCHALTSPDVHKVVQLKPRWHKVGQQ